MRFAGLLLACAFVLESASAFAVEEPTQDSQSRTELKETSGGSKRGTDVTVVPYGGADSDIGVGIGFLASLARLTGNHHPYLYRLEAAGLATFKVRPELEFPYVDAYLLLSLPHAVKDRLKLDFRVSYTRELTLKYYGLGNASEVPDGVALDDSRFEYERIHPTVRLRGESRIVGGTLLVLGMAYTHNTLVIPPGTLLAEEQASAKPSVRNALGPSGDHDVAEFSFGLGWDDRDNPVSATSGQYHTARIDLAPGGFGSFPQRWARIDLTMRVFAPLVPRRLTLAIRGVGDLLVGDPPFYELARYDDSSALGGAKGVRGVPAQRYSGKIKAFANVELRSRLFEFELLSQKNAFGVVAFADGGRLLSDYPPDPELDGTGLGLKYGLGGGLRLYGGSSFVVRADVAWSPDARPFGGYLAAGEVF